MKLEEFKQMFLSLIARGWNGEFATELIAMANDPKQCAKIFNRAKLVAYRNKVNVHDALHALISRGNL